MQIGVVSDTHNNLKNIQKIIELFNKEELEFVVHTGDIASASSLGKFSKLNCALFGVLGNNDRGEEGILEISSKHQFKFQEPPLKISFKNINIAVFHEPDCIDEFLLSNEETHVVLHGHTHRYRNEKKEGVLYFNPGESAGMQKGMNAIGILDLYELNARRIFF